jgi:16S rRNA (guanine527-N7)-methyltransferase
MLVHHLLDSIAVIEPLRRHTGGKPARVLDVGSGAGLPGVVIAALMPELDVTCVDAVGKKAAFVRQAAGELGLKNLHAVHARVEDLAGDPFDVIVSRAFASLADFVALTRRHHGTGSVWVAMKARLADDEVAAVPNEVDMFHVEHLTVPGLDAERCLIWMRKKP